MQSSKLCTAQGSILHRFQVNVRRICNGVTERHENISWSINILTVLAVSHISAFAIPVKPTSLSALPHLQTCDTEATVVTGTIILPIANRSLWELLVGPLLKIA